MSVKQGRRYTLAMTRRVLALLLAVPLAAAPAPAPAVAQTTDFARLAARLSEDAGFFDSDNLVSNETSYLHVLGGLRALGVRGGAYIGVGPEQSFSYIAELRPEIAYIIDIRRDNMLLHLLFKAMFEAADSRLEYLCLLFGRPAPRDLGAWSHRNLELLLNYLEATPADSALHDRQHEEMMRRVAQFGVPLTPVDRTTLRRFHDEFATQGLALTFTSRGRMNRRNYPTVRELYLQTTDEGDTAGYLATDERWRVVRALQRRHRIVPVVGDLAGPRAVQAIAAHLRETRRTVSVLYVSNVEMYLFQNGVFPAFVANVRSLPAGPSSVLVRSWFGRGAMLPSSVPGHLSTQLLQTVPRFLELTARPDSVYYWTLVSDTGDVRIAVPAAARP